MTAYLLVGAGGFFGAIARFGISRLAARQCLRIPYGTLFVNLSGSFLLGIIAALGSSAVSLLFGTGFMGAYTTFSTLQLESLQLWRRPDKRGLLLYGLYSYLPGIALAFAGYGIGIWLT